MLDRPKRTLSTPRKVLFAALATVGLLGAAEVGLRVAGTVYMERYRGSVERGLPQDGGDEVWAFGDSFTFGIGADDPATESYPAVAVEGASRRLGRPLGLKNRARPGLNSTEIVDEFRDSLILAGPRRPAAVVLLAGVNNERWLGQSGQFCLAVDTRTTVQRSLADHSRFYNVIRWVVLQRRPPREADAACIEIGGGFDRLEAERPDQALAAFRRALELDPDNGWGHLGVGLAHARTGDHIAAIPAYRRAVEADLPSPSLPLVLAWSLRAVGDANGAAVLAGQAVEIEYLRDSAEVLLGWLAFDAGDPAAALEHFQVGGHLARTEDGPPGGAGSTPYALDGLGWLALQRGDLTGAATHFRECRVRGDLAGVTPHRLGWCHLGEAVSVLLEGRSEGVAELARVATADPSTREAGAALSAWAVALDEGCAAALPAWNSTPTTPWAAAGLRACEFADPPAPAGALSHLRSSPSANVTAWVDPGDTRLLHADLLRAGRLARDAGVPLYFMTYPNPDGQPELASATHFAGDEAFVPVIDIRDRMRTELAEGAAWSDLFVPDGHPTSRGYRLMGEALGAVMSGTEYEP